MYRDEVGEHEEFFINVFCSRGQIRTDNGTQGIDDFKSLFDAEGALKPEYMECIGRYMIRMTPACYTDACRLFYGSEMQRITGTPATKMWSSK
jgi:hypothetical protein